MVVFIFLAFVTVFAAILCFFQNLRKMKLDIPAPMVIPIIGHAHLIIGLNNEGALETFIKKYSRSFLFYEWTDSSGTQDQKLMNLTFYVQKC